MTDSLETVPIVLTYKERQIAMMAFEAMLGRVRKSEKPLPAFEAEILACRKVLLGV